MLRSIQTDIEISAVYTILMSVRHELICLVFFHIIEFDYQSARTGHVEPEESQS